MCRLRTVCGGATSAYRGGDFSQRDRWEGAKQAGIIAAFNHAEHAVDGEIAEWRAVKEAQKSGDYLVYSGKEIIWYNSQGEVIDRFDASSGLPGFRVSGKQNLKDQGPIPEGVYEINLKPSPNRLAKETPDGNELYASDGLEKIPNGHPEWGNHRARLNPIGKTNTFGRNNFYLHDSQKGYTHGCIEVSSSLFDRIHTYRSSTGSEFLRIVVKCPNSYTPTNGNTLGN